jgi:hypothetical protein
MQPTSPPSGPGATPATPGAGQSFREQALARLRAESAPSPAPVAPVPRRQPPVQPRAEAQQAGNSGQDPQPDHPGAEAGAEDPTLQQDLESADGGKQQDPEGEEPDYGEDVQRLHAELKARDALYWKMRALNDVPLELPKFIAEAQALTATDLETEAAATAAWERFHQLDS